MKQICMSLAIALVAIACVTGSARAQADTPIRIGYPVATLINGQIGHVMANTDILGQHGLDAEVTGFAYGAPMMEAMASDRIDVAFTTEGPAALLLTKGIEASVIATLGGARSGLLVPSGSSVREVADLKGATVAVPFGSTPHFHLVRWLRNAGLDPEADVNVINLGTGELEPALASGSVDAITFWEPNVTQLMRKIDARLIADDRFTFCTIMRRSFIQDHADAAKRFLAAMRQATAYMASNHAEVNQWFAESSRAAPEVIHAASQHTDAYAKPSSAKDVDLSITPTVRRVLADAADFMAAQRGLDADLPDSAVDPSLWEGLVADKR